MAEVKSSRPTVGNVKTLERPATSFRERFSARASFPLGELLNLVVRQGGLEVIDANGRVHRYGTTAPTVTVRLHDRRLHYPTLDPSIGTGEAFMDGSLTIERGTLYELLALYQRNSANWELATAGLRRLIPQSLKRIGRNNSLRKSRNNVAHHYDLGNEMYSLFLDEDMQYSCALFKDPSDTLEQAQQQKKDLLLKKLALEPGSKVLDIGSGWGGLGLELARADADVLGVTLSEPQLKIARARALKEGLASRAQFELKDYRNLEGKFDRVISVGMFEHVGLTHYEEFFSKVRDLLTDDGIAVIHSIGRRSVPGTQNAWLSKYIFPGSYAPALSETLAAIERTGLWATDIEILRVHYADTLVEWRKRFMANRHEVLKSYDERFCRMWEFYLTAVEAAFRAGKYMVFQIQLAKHADGAPRTRDYLYSDESAPAESGTQLRTEDGTFARFKKTARR